MKKKISILIIACLMLLGSISFAGDFIFFTDVPSDHWALQFIYDAQNLGIINGYEDKTFRPEQNVAVGEFIKMVATAYYPNMKYTAPAEGMHWSWPYVEAIDRVILNKYNYDFDTLERTITRAEAARILCVYYMETHSSEELDTSLTLVSSFADEATITDRLDRIAVDNCVRFGLINGHAEDNTFRPLEGLTRCQAAKILCLVKQL